MDVLERTTELGAPARAASRFARLTPGRERAIVATLIALAGVFFLATIRAGHLWGDDFAQYIGHARNLVHGRPYGSTGYLYNPAVPFGGPRTYPPVFPLLLAPVVKLFGLNLFAMKVEGVLFFMASLALIYVLARKHFSFAISAGTVAIVAFSPFFWDFKDNVLSDVPFLFFVMLSFLVADRATRENSAKWGLLAAAAMYLAYGTRTLGIVLLPAFVLTDLVRKRRISRVAVAGSLGFIVAAALQTKLIPGGGSYGDNLKLQTVHLVLVNGWRYLKALERVAFNGYSMAAAGAFFVALLILAVAGYVSRIRRDTFSPAEAFFPLYGLAVVAWPIYQDTRLLIPLIPFFVVYALAGVPVLARALRLERWRAVVATALAAAFVLSYATLYPKLDFGPIKVGVDKPESRQVFAYIRSHTAPGEIVIFRRPKALALYTDRPSSGYGPGLPDAEQLRNFAEINARYLLVSNYDRPFLSDFAARHPDVLVPMYRNPDFDLYRIRTA